jgi:hypothetical protein
MLALDQIFQEIQASQNLAAVRQRYLGELASHVKQNVIGFYSGWQSRPDGIHA